MGREVLPLTLDRLTDIPEHCSACVFWELAPALSNGGRECPRNDKEGWLTTTLLEWGSPGRVAYVDGQPAGYIMFAPAHLVPRALAFPTSPVSADAVVLMTARMDERYAGQGLGRVLVQSAAKDVLRRGVRALEAYGSRGPVGECLLPTDFLLAVGFRTARDHPTYPRLRMDLRTALRWRSEVEQAVEKLFAPVRGLGARQPVGTVHLDSPPPVPPTPQRP
ncbi:MAG: GNAT family N-acetyltransferase [Actinomycetota bacterium]|nr:GNAT family N-acetyltransferase [Actinomycetota bacterium]